MNNGAPGYEVDEDTYSKGSDLGSPCVYFKSLVQLITSSTIINCYSTS